MHEAARRAVEKIQGGGRPAPDVHPDRQDTTFIVQGITGREAVNLTRECLDYGAGAKVVGGVTPGRKGREVHGVPVFDTVRQAVEHHGEPIKGSVVTVPPVFTKDAVFEAIENGIELVVIVTERIPRGDVAQMVELAELRGARIIGPNCLGIIVPEEIKMGGIGGPARDAAKAYSPGPVGVISRSGGMTTEMSSTLTAAGLGQSTAVSIGGDAIIGSTYAELMPLFEADEQTEAIVIYTEPGGRMEAELSEWVRRAPLAPADRGLHGRALHGRDAGHGLRPRGHNRGGQGGHGHGEDRAAGLGGDHRGGGDLSDPRTGQAAPRKPRAGSAGCARIGVARVSAQHGIFIRVDVSDDARGDAELARRLEEACPVDIFAARGRGVEIVEENLDECVLCGLCLDASPPGAVRVVKLYDNQAVLERV